MSLEQIRLSEDEKKLLVAIKRRTGFKNWNIPCRWALALSLTEQVDPPAVPIISDSNVEMSWKTFAGDHADIYRALVIHRCVQEGRDPTADNIVATFRHHLHRGLGYLRGNDEFSSINGVIAAATTT